MPEALGSDAPVSSRIPRQKPLPDPIAADGAEIVIEIRDDQVDLPLGIDLVEFKGLGDHLKNDAFLFALGRNGL